MESEDRATGFSGVKKPDRHGISCTIDLILALVLLTEMRPVFRQVHVVSVYVPGEVSPIATCQPLHGNCGNSVEDNILVLACWCRAAISLNETASVHEHEEEKVPSDRKNQNQTRAPSLKPRGRDVKFRGRDFRFPRLLT